MTSASNGPRYRLPAPNTLHGSRFPLAEKRKPKRNSWFWQAANLSEDLGPSAPRCSQRAAVFARGCRSLDPWTPNLSIHASCSSPLDRISGSPCTSQPGTRRDSYHRIVSIGNYQCRKLDTELRTANFQTCHQAIIPCDRARSTDDVYFITDLRLTLYLTARNAS